MRPNPFTFYLLFADGVARAAEQILDFDRSRPRSALGEAPASRRRTPPGRRSRRQPLT